MFSTDILLVIIIGLLAHMADTLRAIKNKMK